MFDVLWLCFVCFALWCALLSASNDVVLQMCSGFGSSIVSCYGVRRVLFDIMSRRVDFSSSKSNIDPVGDC